MSQEPPLMFRQPTDPPEPLPPLRSNPHIVKLHTEWARLHATPSASPGLSTRVRGKVRSAASRLVGTADDQVLGDLVRAIDAVAAHCDELSERVAHLQVTADDLTRALGHEITQLRAAVERATGPALGTPTPPTQ